VRADAGLLGGGTWGAPGKQMALGDAYFQVPAMSAYHFAGRR